MQRSPRYAPKGKVLRLPAFEDAWYGSEVPPEHIAALLANRLLAGHSREAVTALLPAFRFACLPLGATVTDERSIARRMYLILDGRVGLLIGGADAPVEVVRARGFFGEASVLGREFHGHVARCLEATALCSIEARDLGHVLGASPIFGLTIARALYGRLQLSLDRLCA